MARLRFEHEQGTSAPVEADATIEPGQRSFSVSPPAGVTLAPGRYVVRVQLTAKGSVVPIQTTTDVTIPAPTALLSSSGIASRRGPQTGLNYIATADARFRRTERLRLEVPRVAEGGTLSARLLGRDGQPLSLGVILSERQDTAQQLTFIVMDVTLAALAQGDYVVELSLEKEGKKEGSGLRFQNRSLIATARIYSYQFHSSKPPVHDPPVRTAGSRAEHRAVLSDDPLKQLNRAPGETVRAVAAARSRGHASSSSTTS